MMAILPSLGNGADGLLGFGTTSLPALENGADTLPGLVMTGPPEPESVSAPLQQATNDQHDRSSRCIRPTRLSRMPTRRLYCSARPIILWVPGREQWQDVFRAVRGPSDEQAMVGQIEQSTAMNGHQAWISTHTSSSSLADELRSQRYTSVTSLQTNRVGLTPLTPPGDCTQLYALAPLPPRVAGDQVPCNRAWPWGNVDGMGSLGAEQAGSGRLL